MTGAGGDAHTTAGLETGATETPRAPATADALGAWERNRDHPTDEDLSAGNPAGLLAAALRAELIFKRGLRCRQTAP